jgi:CheY-like chemotaxis protein
MARIVIAGEQAHIRHVLTTWLSRYGHDVTEVGTGEAALAALQQRPVDVLITDLDLSVHGQGRLVPAALGLGQRVRRVFVLGSPRDRRQTPARGADPRVSFLPTPFSPARLLLDVAAAGDGREPTAAGSLEYVATTPDAAGVRPAYPTAPGGDA